jgi:hypothetical protein
MECSCSIENKINVSAPVTTVTSDWNLKDYLGATRVRMSLGRNNYAVKPGLYQLGNPDKSSEVFISSNYKLSFDILRKNLSGLNAWILVLDTKGINVWCAAGKGTFGTNELIRKITDNKLQNVVQHRKIIVPQLGAPGVSGYKVKDATGFTVKFGPVRACDIKEYLSSKGSVDESLRQVSFNFMDRLILAPVEIVNSLKYLLIVVIALGIVTGINIVGKSITFSIEQTFIPILLIVSAYLAGAFLTPVLLPWIPSRYFSMKGLIMGSLVFLLIFFTARAMLDTVAIFGWFFFSLAISSFLAMNFTGASTYTSLSGVKKEMKIFVPIQIGLIVVGLFLVLTSKFLTL